MGAEGLLPPDGACGLAWRPLTTGDVPAWARLVTAIDDVDNSIERSTADDLEDELVKGSWKDPARDTLAGFDEGGDLRAFGLVEVRPGDVRTVRAYCFGGVDPTWREREIGAVVMGWQRGRAAEKVRAARGRRWTATRCPLGSWCTPTSTWRTGAGWRWPRASRRCGTTSTWSAR